MATSEVLLAHQGGWDEALLVLTPIAVLGTLLWVANRRARRALEARDVVDQTEPEGA